MLETLETKWRKIISDANFAKGDLLAEIPDEEFDPNQLALQLGGTPPSHLQVVRDVAKRFPAMFRKLTFANLDWFYFNSAICWPDAEVWLAIASRKGWTTLEMRRRRFEES